MNGFQHIYDDQRIDREEKEVGSLKTNLCCYALMNQLDQFCNNFSIRRLQRMTFGRLDGCKVKTMNLRLRSPL